VSIAGARNAGLLAVRILAAHDPHLLAAMRAFQDDLEAQARAKGAVLRVHLSETQSTDAS
jgi:5-(carboxyamino)imidazole ribonucleotide mutase